MLLKKEMVICAYFYAVPGCPDIFGIIPMFQYGGFFRVHIFQFIRGDDLFPAKQGMRKTDKFTPVITVVVYYGEKAWDGATTLHDMLNIPCRNHNP